MPNLPESQPFNLIKSLLSHKQHIKNQLTSTTIEANITPTADNLIANIEQGLAVICQQEIKQTDFVISSIYHGSYGFCSGCGKRLANNNSPLITTCAPCSHNDNLSGMQTGYASV